MLFVTVITIVTVGLHKGGTLIINVFPVPEKGVVQAGDTVQLTEVTDQPPNTMEVLFMVMVLLPLMPHTTLLLKLAFTGTDVVV